MVSLCPVPTSLPKLAASHLPHRVPPPSPRGCQSWHPDTVIGSEGHATQAGPIRGLLGTVWLPCVGKENVGHLRLGTVRLFAENLAVRCSTERETEVNTEKAEPRDGETALMLTTKDVAAVSGQVCFLAGSSVSLVSVLDTRNSEGQAVFLILPLLLCLCHCPAEGTAPSLTCPRVQPGQVGVGLPVQAGTVWSGHRSPAHLASVAVFMEVSSHALDFEGVLAILGDDGIPTDAAHGGKFPRGRGPRSGGVHADSHQDVLAEPWLA